MLVTFPQAVNQGGQRWVGLRSQFALSFSDRSGPLGRAWLVGEVFESG